MKAESDTRGAHTVGPARLRDYVGALAITGAAAVLQYMAWRHIPPSPFLFFYPAVMLSAWLFGFGPAAISTAASATLIGYFFLYPVHSIRVEEPGDALDLGIFCALSLMLAHLLASSRKATTHATRQATIALRKAEEASAAKDDVLAIVSHDLKNPLHTISFSADVINTLAAQNESPRIGEHAMRIRRASERATRLVADLLDASKIESGTLQLQISRSPIELLIEEALSPLTPVAEARGVRIDVSVAPGSWIHGDRDRLIRVLANVLGNAVQYIAPGGEVLVRAEASERSARIEVRDTGPGMTRDQVEHACDRYWRGRADVAGTGLGLYISREIVRAHGGEMQISSDERRGTTVTIVLPQPEGAQVRAAGDAVRGERADGDRALIRCFSPCSRSLQIRASVGSVPLVSRCIAQPRLPSASQDHWPRPTGD